MEYAEHVLPEHKQHLERVKVKRDYRKLTGYYALKGAVGIVVSDDCGLRSVLFERESSHLVKPDCRRQCMLSRIPSFYLSFDAEGYVTINS